MRKLVEKTRIDDGCIIIGEGTFLECVEALLKKEADYIYGPEGGVLKLDERGCLVFRNDKDIYFSAKNYLGIWRILVFDLEKIEVEKCIS